MAKRIRSDDRARRASLEAAQTQIDRWQELRARPVVVGVRLPVVASVQEKNKIAVKQLVNLEVISSSLIAKKDDLKTNHLKHRELQKNAFTRWAVQSDIYDMHLAGYDEKKIKKQLIEHRKTQKFGFIETKNPKKPADYNVKRMDVVKPRSDSVALQTQKKSKLVSFGKKLPASSAKPSLVRSLKKTLMLCRERPNSKNRRGGGQGFMRKFIPWCT